ncbi:MAG: alkaline phosphatase, partial [Planctomycetota bacterium]
MASGPAGAQESPEAWYAQGRKAVAAARKIVPITEPARNIILFVGDGMGVSTVTAARILEGQLNGRHGEEHELAFEKLPYTALVKTYCTNQQVADSAGSMSAIATGIKTKAGVLSVNQRVPRGDFRNAETNSQVTILEHCEKAGIATGIVSTARITHATPAALFAHSAERNWEGDHDLPSAARQSGVKDIARQLIEFPFGDGVDVMLGGGRLHFLPSTAGDPEYAQYKGYRLDGINLIDSWLGKTGGVYVWNREQFDALGAETSGKVLGLFEPSHMKYEFDRDADKGGEPSLAEMTEKAIELLAARSQRYFLMVEGARIDHAHHLCNAYRALTDTLAFSDAVAVARKMTDRNDTMIIVTADHSHVFTMGGYPVRGNPILGKVIQPGAGGAPTDKPAKASDGRPFTTLAYTNGPGYRAEHPRPD